MFGAVAVGLLLLLAYPMFLGQVYIDTDLGRYHLPLRHFHAESLARGDSPVWCPYEYSGFYLHGEGQLGLYHPLNWLQFRWLPFVAAFDLEILRNYAFLLIGTYLFLRRSKLPRDASLLGSLLFTFSSFNVCYFMHPNFVGIAAHLPWLLLAIDLLLRGERHATRVFAWVGAMLLTASQLLLGHPQATWMCLVVGGLYALFTLGSRRREEPESLRPRSAIGALGLAVALGFLVASVQLLPQWETSQASYRATTPASFGASPALSPIQASVQLVAPQVNLPRVLRVKSPSRVLFVGALAPVLLAWGCIRGRRLGPRRFRLFLAGTVLAALGLVLAFGWLYRLQHLLPVVGHFRAPTRYSLFVVLGVAVASAVSYADLARAARSAARFRGFWWLGAPFAASVAVAAVVLSGQASVLQVSGQPTWRVLLGPILIGACTLLAATAARGRPGALLLLPLIVGVDLGLHTWRYVRGDWAPPVEPYAFGRPPPPVDPGTRVDRGPEAWVMHGLRLASGYSSMPPPRSLPIGRRGASSKRDRARLEKSLRVASVGWAFRRPVLDALPRARLVSRAEVGDVDRLDRLDVERVALVDEPVELGGGPAGSATLVEDRAGKITIKTRASTRQLLVLSESRHDGWKALVDGKPCSVLRVYLDFMGCVVDAGEHRVVFHFAPASLRIGKRMSLAGLVLGAVVAAVALIRRRRVERSSAVAARSAAGPP